MLPPFIIEQIRKRESEDKARHEQPRLELPLDYPRPRAPVPADSEDSHRGIVILELL